MNSVSYGRSSTGDAAAGQTTFWSVTLTLMLLSVMSYLDRQILGLLVPNLHRDLGLSDLQVGTLIGPAFIVTYLIALVVAAFIVDRYNKVMIIACGTVFWAVMTFASAFAKSYEELLVLRAGLAVGEAMLGPAATALIGALFPDDRRKRLMASAVFLMGSVLGASGWAVFGAFAIQVVQTIHVTLPRIGDASEWRLVLIAVSLPSFLLAFVLMLVGRGGGGNHAVAAGPAVHTETLREHLRRRGLTYLIMFAAVNVMVTIQSSTLIWGPSYLMRNFGLGQVAAGYLLGAVALTSGITGMLASTPILSRWVPAGNAAQFKRLTLAVGPAGMGLLAAAMLMPTLALCVPVLLVALMVTGVLVTLPMQFLQSVAPVHLKGRIAVGMYLILYFFTTGLGPLVPPTIARLLSPGNDQLGRAIAIGCVVTTAIALLLLTILPTEERRKAP